MSNFLLWTDIETTGLDLENGAILEIAFVLWDPDGKELWQYDKPIQFLDREKLDPWALENHGRSGLLVACESSTYTLASVYSDYSEVLGVLVPKNDKIIMAGSSIHFDRTWIKHFAPEFINHLHYRLYDVSSLIPFCKAVGIKYPDPDKAHRAMADVRRSIGIHHDLVKDVKEFRNKAWKYDELD